MKARPDTVAAASGEARSVVGMIAQLIRHLSARRRGQLAGLLALMVLGAAAEMATLGAVVPFLTALMTGGNNISPFRFLQDWWPQGGMDVTRAATLFISVTLAATLIRVVLSKASFTVAFRAGVDLDVLVYRNILGQPYEYHLANNSSSAIAAISKTGLVVTNVLSPAIQAVVAIVVGGAMVIALLLLDPMLALSAGLVFTAFYSLSGALMRSRLHRNSAAVARGETERVRAMQEGLGSIREVIIDGIHSLFTERFTKVDSAMRLSQADNGFLATSPRFVLEAIGMLLIGALAFPLSSRPGGFAGAVPVLGALVLGAQRLLPQAQALYWAWSGILGVRVPFNEVLAALALVPQQSSPLESVAWDPAAPLAQFRNVTFSYSTGATPVIQDLSLDLPARKRVAIVGQTGSGKTTLVDLLLGLLTPQSGELWISGNKLEASTRRSWHNRIAHVPQSVYLLDASIAENIALGTTEIDMDRVRMAALAACAADFIEELPDRYDTVIGERGSRLSGGQRQRIGLARALYKQADVLVLDEATSALDEATEAEVLNSIMSSRSEMSIIMITHRLSALRHCDAVLDVDKKSASWRRIGAGADVPDVARSP